MADEKQSAAGAIYSEARGAHTTAKEILELMTAPGEGDEEDPMTALVEAVKELALGQAEILRRLERIERRLGGAPSA